MNVKLLKSKMILYGDEEFVTAISNLLKITRQTASAKLSCESDFNRTEIALISKHYGLTDEEIRRIFVEDDINES